MRIQVWCVVAVWLLTAGPGWAQEGAAQDSEAADAAQTQETEAAGSKDESAAKEGEETPEAEPPAEAEGETPESDEADKETESTEAEPSEGEPEDGEATTETEETESTGAEAEKAEAGAESPETEALETKEGVLPPVSPQCYERCKKTCGCWTNFGGGGPFLMVLFNDYSSAFGDYDGPSIWLGGRGYGYLGDDNEWRLGGMGAGGSGSIESDIAINHPLYSASTSRSLSGGYGGFTAEYVLRAGNVAEFPMGILIGGGGSGFESELIQRTEQVKDVKTLYRRESGFLALQPMVGAEANAAQWAKISITLSYLLTEPLGSTARTADGFAFMFGVHFGKFFAEEFAM